MKTITVEVTQEDIKKGRACDGTYCPIALALKRKIKRPCLVGVKDIDIYNPKSKYTLHVPQIKLFVGNFDHGNKVEPFTFELQVFAEDIKDEN